jgi:hypothetical protein
MRFSTPMCGTTRRNSASRPGYYLLNLSCERLLGVQGAMPSGSLSTCVAPIEAMANLSFQGTRPLRVAFTFVGSFASCR